VNRLALLAVTVAAVTLATGCAKKAHTGDASGGSAATGPTALAGPDLDRGKQIYLQNCAACHGASGEGGVGPALKGEHTRKDREQAIAWIKDPQPPMPKLYPAPLSDRDVANVAAYVESL
jgi:mono/diheme cytochrome c family protein